jgi:hypothetical protein
VDSFYTRYKGVDNDNSTQTFFPEALIELICIGKVPKIRGKLFKVFHICIHINNIRCLLCSLYLNQDVTSISPQIFHKYTQHAQALSYAFQHQVVGQPTYIEIECHQISSNNIYVFR